MILCADDFGLAPDIDTCISELAARDRLSAVSCMVALRSCHAYALTHLIDTAPRVALGLHLTFTGPDELEYARPGSSLRGRDGEFLPYHTLLLRALRGDVRERDARAEIQVQYDLFLSKAGRPPEFLDCHLHMHQLPGIRQALVAFVAALPPAARPYVRNTGISIGDALRLGVAPAKCLVVARPGWALRRLLHAAGLRTNTRFAGVYNYNRWPQFPRYLDAFMAYCHGTDDLIMVHPGRNEPWRELEYQTLSALDPSVR